MSENVELLLDIFKTDLDAQTLELLSDKFLHDEALTYLESLLDNEHLLSTSYITPSTDLEPNNKDIKTLGEEIAELDSYQREINTNLQKITSENTDLILDSRDELNRFQIEFNSSFKQKVEEMLVDLETKKETGPTEDEINEHVAHNAVDSDDLTDIINMKAKLLENMDTITDLLELPTLLKLCILQGNYQESLEISLHINRLYIRFPDSVIIKKIESMISQELNVMLKGLVKLLNTNLKQTAIIKIFQILRKLHPFNKMPSDSRTKNLKIIYLNSRSRFINNELSSLTPLKSRNIENYLKRSIEVIREFGFNSIIVYQSIFPDIDLTKRQDSYLYNFIKNIMQNLMGILVENFGKLEESSLRDGLILQLIYCSQSLSRFGSEFQNLVLYELVDKYHIIEDSDWLRGIKKQRTLGKGLRA